jgi:hypothetical protein
MAMLIERLARKTGFFRIVDLAGFSQKPFESAEKVH